MRPFDLIFLPLSLSPLVSFYPPVVFDLAEQSVEQKYKQNAGNATGGSGTGFSRYSTKWNKRNTFKLCLSFFQSENATKKSRPGFYNSLHTDIFWTYLKEPTTPARSDTSPGQKKMKNSRKFCV